MIHDRTPVDVPAAARRARALVQAFDEALDAVVEGALLLPSPGGALEAREREALAAQVRADLTALTSERARVALEAADWAARANRAAAQARPDLRDTALRRAADRAALVTALDAELAQLRVVAAHLAAAAGANEILGGVDAGTATARPLAGSQGR